MQHTVSLPWIAVESSWIDAICYLPDSRYLYLRLYDGGGYCFHQVPADVANELFMASSKGTFINIVVKPRYHFERIVA